MSKKVKATGMISQLFRKTEHFEMLLSHDTLLQVRGMDNSMSCELVLG